MGCVATQTAVLRPASQPSSLVSDYTFKRGWQLCAGAEPTKRFEKLKSNIQACTPER